MTETLPSLRVLASQAATILENSMFEFVETGKQAQKLGGEIRMRLSMDELPGNKLLNELQRQAAIFGQAAFVMGVDWSAECMAEKKNAAARAIYAARFPEAPPVIIDEHFAWYDKFKGEPASSVHGSNVWLAIRDAEAALAAAGEIPTVVVPRVKAVDMTLTPEDKAILHIEKAARGLAEIPEHKAELARFVDYWGMDAYEPPEGVYKTVRKLVTAFLILTDEQKP